MISSDEDIDHKISYFLDLIAHKVWVLLAFYQEYILYTLDFIEYEHNKISVDLLHFYSYQLMLIISLKSSFQQQDDIEVPPLR